MSAKVTGVQIDNDGVKKFAGNIANSGAVTSKSNDGIQINSNAGSGAFTGNITNSGKVLAKTTGVQIENNGESDFTGNIANTGAVTSTSSVGIRIEDDASDGAFTGNITNTGAVSAVAHGIEIEGDGQNKFSGSIGNSGAVIASTGTGVSISNIAGIGTFSGSIANKGVVSAQKVGVEIANVGEFEVFPAASATAAP